MNKKGFKVVQISGLKGIFLLCFVLFGLFCGFVIFPVWLIMQIWNYGLVELIKIPALSTLQGSLIWSIVCVLAYMSCRNCFSIKAYSEEMIDNDIDIKKVVQEYEPEKEELHK